jgi:NADPH2:quinone reductase
VQVPVARPVTMRAAYCRELGPPEVVRVEDVATPGLTPGQVRVAVDAAAVNFPDVLLVAGDYQIKVPPPFVPGSEFAGVVAEIGEGVDGIAGGDRVFGSGIVGAFAEQTVAPAPSLTRVPDGVDIGFAAAFGVAHRTAYHVLRSVATVAGGDEVIVLGAGGGVGLATVQLATLLGARVTAVASSDEKLAVAEEMGAAARVNHRSGELRAQLRAALPDGADVVVDPVGGELAEPALRALRYGGRFVTVGYASGTIPRIPLNLVLLKGIQIVGFEMLSFLQRHPDEVVRNERELLDHLGAGRAFPHIGASFPLEQAGAALRYVADGRAIGKVLLTVRAT